MKILYKNSELQSRYNIQHDWQSCDEANTLYETTNVYQLGDMVTLHAQFELGSFHTSKVKLWDAVKDAHGKEVPRSDLTLHTEYDDVEIVVEFISSLFEEEGGFERFHSVLDTELGVIAAIKAQESERLTLEAIAIFQAL